MWITVRVFANYVSTFYVGILCITAGINGGEQDEDEYLIGHGC
jgi:hypothetical protein